jgi:hypothetical protein
MAAQIVLRFPPSATSNQVAPKNPFARPESHVFQGLLGIRGRRMPANQLQDFEKKLLKVQR